MARRVSFSALESRSARLRLKIRRRPFSGPSLARGILLMYRRNKNNGTWVLKVSDGRGAYWTKAFAHLHTHCHCSYCADTSAGPRDGPLNGLRRIFNRSRALRLSSALKLTLRAM